MWPAAGTGIPAGIGHPVLVAAEAVANPSSLTYSSGITGSISGLSATQRQRWAQYTMDGLQQRKTNDAQPYHAIGTCIRPRGARAAEPAAYAHDSLGKVKRRSSAHHHAHADVAV